MISSIDHEKKKAKDKLYDKKRKDDYMSSIIGLDKICSMSKSILA